ncbi:hypothetical protein TcasGA2_TC002751 [Tribolium castaneum]|uniref:Uncharacterized protein n=1 Tax=Tribolium castaneum TaxID=7070 RepID=D6WDL6_TRICA|nr:hypothetical protein TcasGA2_TC002751 [Tribolium castaneum]
MCTPEWSNSISGIEPFRIRFVQRHIRKSSSKLILFLSKTNPESRGATHQRYEPTAIGRLTTCDQVSRAKLTRRGPRQCSKQQPFKTVRYGSTVRFQYEIGFRHKFHRDSLICYFVRFQLLTIYENQFQRCLIAKPASINYTLHEFASNSRFVSGVEDSMDRSAVDR